MQVVRGFEIVRRHLRAEPPSHSKAAPAPTLQPSSARERAAVRRAAARSAERLLAAAAAWVCSEAACAHARGDVARVALLYGNALDLFAPLRAVLRVRRPPEGSCSACAHRHLGPRVLQQE